MSNRSDQKPVRFGCSYRKRGRAFTSRIAALFLSVMLSCLYCLSFAAPDQFSLDVADISLLMSREVIEELKISPSQEKTMQGHLDQYLKKADQMQKNSKSKPSKAQISELDKSAKLMRHKILGVMSDSQVKRLAEISLQYAGTMALTSDVVAKRLGLSKSQVSKITKVGKEYYTSLDAVRRKNLLPVLRPYGKRKPKNKKEAELLSKEIQKKTDDAEKKMQPQIEKLQKEKRNEALSVLSVAQRSTWASLQGKPFLIP